MSATCDSKELLNALTLAATCSEAKASTLRHECVKISFFDNQIALECTNLKLFSRILVSSTVTDDGFISFFVEIKKVINLVKKLSGEITIEPIGDKISFKSNSFETLLQQQQIEEKDYIYDEQYKEINVTKENWCNIVTASCFASPFSTSFSLNMVYVELYKNIVANVVATDGHRLYVVREHVEKDRAIKIGIDAINTIKKICGDSPSVFVGETSMIIEKHGYYKFCFVYPREEFPNYSSLLPKEYKYEISFNSKELTNAIKNVINNKNDVVILEIKDYVCEVTSRDSDNKTTISSSTDKPVKVAFNPKYLSEGVQGLKNKEIKIHWYESKGLFKIISDDVDKGKYYLMPVHTRE